MKPSTRYTLVVILPAIILPALVIPAVYAYIADTVETEFLLFATLAGLLTAVVSALLIERLLVAPVYSTIGEMLQQRERTMVPMQPEEALRMTEELVTELVNSMDMFVIAERDGRVVYRNRGTDRLLGYHEKLLNAPLEHIFLDREDFKRLLKRAEQDGMADAMEMKVLSGNGSVVCVALSVFFLKERECFILVAQDRRQYAELARRLESMERELTERIKHLEDFRAGVLSMVKDLEESENRLHNAYIKLRNTQAQLVHSSKLKAMGEFTAGLAHELAQPLTAIRGLVLHMLKHKELYKDDAGKLELISKATEKMEKVISHLRTFSRIDKAVFKPVDVNRVVEDAFLIAGEMLKKTRIKVEKRLSQLPPIMGNQGALEQVVINLLSNAKDAMPQGGTLTVSTELMERNGKRYIKLAVKDTGCGIPEDVLPRIFEPFFTTKDVDRGTGLGLSISYGIIKDHRGDILVESTEGKGTTFSVLLPVAEKGDVSR